MKLEDIGFYTLSDERAKNTSVTSKMQRCEMIITEYCNFNCPYCRGLDDEIYGDRKIKQLSVEEIKRNIDFWTSGKGLENIRFSGGEPTLHKNIREIIQYARIKGIKRVALSTNGYSDLDLYKRLVEAGVNDFSISLDACCASTGDEMAGKVKNSWRTVVENIAELSKLTYVTVGVVLTPENVHTVDEIIKFASGLGVSDIRIIPSAQWNEKLDEIDTITQDIIEGHPILKYRFNNIRNGRHVRVIREEDSHKCPLVLDDSIIAGDFHFPCVIYMREQGEPIGRVNPDMRSERAEWFEAHNSFKDDICRNNCLDVCVDYNNKVMTYKAIEGGTDEKR